MAFLRVNFIPDEHREKFFFTIEEVSFLQKLGWVRREYEHAKAPMPDSQERSVFQTTATARYEQELGTAFFCKTSSKAPHRGYPALTELGTIAQAPEHIFQSPHYRGTTLRKSFRDFLQSMQSAFPEEKNCRWKLAGRCRIPATRREMSSAVEAIRTLIERGIHRRED